MTKGRLLIIDPAVLNPEVSCFNIISKLSPLSVSYHLPVILGMDSIKEEEELNETRGAVLLGSYASVNDQHPWQKPLEKWVSQKIHSNVPLICICYGHQLVASMYGAKVENLKSKCVGFRKTNIIGLNYLNNNAEGSLFTSHQQAVKTKPNELELLAKSSQVHYDGFRIKNKPIWTFQAHLESSPQFCLNSGFNKPGEISTKLQFGHKILSSILELIQKYPNND